MRVFSGFPAGKIRTVPLPALFFSEILPNIDSLAELKVTLHVMWRISQKRSYPPGVSGGQLLGDVTLLQGFGGNAEAARASIQEGLKKAVARGSLLLVTYEDGDALYFVNSDKGRQAAEHVRSGKATMEGEPLVGDGRPAERPNIFQLYEQNVGLLQPMISDQLIEAERTYPPEWIEDAFREAAAQNKRNWRYIQRILERWETEGRDQSRGKDDDRRRYVEGKYAEYYKPQRHDDE